jgi:hypothetical protein
MDCTYPVQPNRGYRGVDAQGDGAFGAERIHHGVKEPHKGQDFVTQPGDLIVSPIYARAKEPGYAYPDFRGDLRSIHLVGVGAWRGWELKILYAKPKDDLFDRVDQGQVIGVAQDLSEVYQGITNHIHLEVHVWNGVSMVLMDPRTLFMKPEVQG